MADWHALTGSPDGNRFRVIHHIPIPAGASNRVGVAYRTALVNSGLGGATALPDGDGSGGTISAAERTAIEAGGLYEHAEDIATHPGESAAALQARIDARHAELVTMIQDQIQKRLTYFGFTRDVP